MEVKGTTSSLSVQKVQPIKTIGEEKLEIERRFLIKKSPENLEQYKHSDIEQGYLSTKEGTSIRIRKKGDKFYQTIKKGTGKIRKEFEVEIQQGLYNILWKETKGRRLEKTRYEIPYEGKIIEFDIYKGKLGGLVTAEVEFESEEKCDSFIPPDWFGAEVTEMKEFTNKYLATHGISRALLRKLTS